ncbi:MAG: hypothetical protein ACI3ZL_01125 [Candidatus Cryptobacteroides sp.]
MGRRVSTGMKVIAPSGNTQAGKMPVLDIFVFNDDRLKRLDSYQRIEDWDSDIVEIASCSGDKIVYAIANSGYGRFGWAQVNSINSLDRIFASLEDEEMDNPVMSGVMRMTAAGGSNAGSLELKPLGSRIVIRSIRCDFSGLPYSEECIRQARAYLVNVNAECQVTASGRVLPTRIINSGRFDEADMSRFRDRNLLEHRFGKEIGKDWIEEEVSFICYPNSGEEESPGSPFTRLVIEGVVEGHTYYWPVAVNRENPGGEDEGIFRNNCYIYDIDIRRKGNTDPDMEIGAEDIVINMEIARWEEKEECEMLF